MTRKLISVLLAALMLLGAIPALADDAGITVTDMLGREVTLDAPATRVVALTASDCEILCALGCEELLVGRGQYCDYPETILDVPAVESGAGTNVEQIIALEPQLVIMSSMAQTSEQAEALENAGIKVAISEAPTIEDVYTSIRMIATLVDKEEEAEAIIADMQDTFAAISEKAADIGDPTKTVYFEVSPLQWGLYTAGKGTFMDELATMCGLTNAFNDLEEWAQISEEQVLERDPDYIVTITMYFGEGPTPVEEILGRTGWENLKAIKNEAILNADSNEISRPGPRLKNAAETLFSFIYGEDALADDAEAEPAA